MNTAQPLRDRRRLFGNLITRSGSRGNAVWLACMLASWHTGKGVMPAYLGLAPDAFHAMMARYFPGTKLPPPAERQSRRLTDMPEREELRALFADYAADHAIERRWIADILIAGCSGSGHLWEDLGLFSRSELTAMIGENFPELGRKNNRNMKWKKFIYKQLCEREGIIACPVPSCELCKDYAICFGSEEESCD